MTLFATLVYMLSFTSFVVLYLVHSCFFMLFLQVASSINHCLFWCQLTTEVTEHIKCVTIWNCNPCNCSINAHNGGIFLLLLHQNALCGSCQCRTKSNIAQQNLQNFTISVPF